MALPGWQCAAQAESGVEQEIANSVTFVSLKIDDVFKLDLLIKYKNKPTERLVFVVLAFWRKPCSVSPMVCN